MDGTKRKSRLQRRACRPSYLWGGLVLAGILSGLLPAAELAATGPTQTAAIQTRPGQPQPATAGQPTSGRTGAIRTNDRIAGRRPKIDHAVTPAGGVAPGQATCSHCQRSACPQCRLAEGHQHEHGRCQHGLCPAHCPVRPDVFGYYGTRWRKWPGSGVVQASNNEAATPAAPPRAEVPGVDEESLESDVAPADLPAPDAASLQMIPDNGRQESLPTAAVDRQPALIQELTDQGPVALDDAPLHVSQAESAVFAQSAEGTLQEQDAMPAAETTQTAWRTFTNSPPPVVVRP